VRDKDLDLLLSITSDVRPEGEAVEDDTDELRWIVQRSIGILGLLFGALVIPEKASPFAAPATVHRPRRAPKFLTRTHRHLLTWAQLQGKTLVREQGRCQQLARSAPVQDPVLPVRQSRTACGLFALFRTEDMEDFDHRHTRIARLLRAQDCRCPAGKLRCRHRPLTRPAFERHTTANLARPPAPNRMFWSTSTSIKCI